MNTTDNAPGASVQPVVRPMDCYVGIKSCGCMVAWVYDSKEHPKDVAKSVAKFIRDGYRVESANTDDIRSKLGPCKCNRPNDQAQRPVPETGDERKETHE